MTAPYDEDALHLARLSLGKRQPSPADMARWDGRTVKAKQDRLEDAVLWLRAELGEPARVTERETWMKHTEQAR